VDDVPLIVKEARGGNPAGRGL